MMADMTLDQELQFCWDLQADEQQRIVFYAGETRDAWNKIDSLQKSFRKAEKKEESARKMLKMEQNVSDPQQIDELPKEICDDLKTIQIERYDEVQVMEPCCRMLGTVNGRGDFSLIKGVQWGEDGALVMKN